MGERVLALSDDLDDRELASAEADLYAYNVATTGVTDGDRVAFALRDERGALAGCVAGYTWGGCLDIRLLWVRDDWRGRGWGTRLLGAAEALGRERGCERAVLDTHSFQAPHFYERLGYTVFGVLDDYPRGHQKYYLTKRLR